MKLTAQTTICGIIGNPVTHSLSPAMHNAGYEFCGLDFAYLAFPVTDLKSAIEGVRALHIRGISVTIPHKIAVMQYLDQIDIRAKKIGAVNTIVHSNGILIGYNTDAEGAMRALKEKISLSGKHVVVLGAGGAARAIISGLREHGCDIFIINRTQARAKLLAAEFNCQYGDVSQIPCRIKQGNILVNTTSVGMNEHDMTSIVPEDSLHKNLTVFDIVYTRGETQLIKNAVKAGCTTVSGRMMLLYQAGVQFELFTGIPAPIEAMKKTLCERSEYGR